MKRFWPALAFCACAIALPHAADAAPRKPVRKASAKPTAKPVPKPIIPAVIAAVPVIPGGFMVPKAIVLRPTTPAESEANSIWNLRAALNVAALQCQISPFLSTVKNYNAFLTQHGEELTHAQMVLLGHFRRYDRARAGNSFDQYVTRTYNSFSTLDAQYQFCDAAGLVGREVLTIPKNGLGKEAARRSGEIRAALEHHPLSPALEVVPMTPLQLPVIAADS